tara:strand:- start:617 stop:1813 length:1197 start_codon:yes stop_codon:yes gene_type:complete
MAVTIQQQPDYPGVTYSRLLYSVTSNLYNKPQYQYVMDVVSGSTVLTTLEQFPNPAGAGVFDVSRILNDYLEYPTNLFDSSTTSTFGKSQQSFEIKFGEKFGTSPSSSVTLYNGKGGIARPAVTGSTAIVWPGTVDDNNGEGYDWSDVYSANRYLTTYPGSRSFNAERDFKKIGLEDYCLKAYYGSNVSGNIYVRLYNQANGLLDTIDLKSTVSANGTYIPSGPKNFLLAGASQSDINNTFWYNIQVGTDYFYYCIDQDSCHYDRVNFLFINKFGVWDCYGINLPQRKTTSIERHSITRPFVDWSNTTSTYDVKSRGKDYYNLKVKDSYTVTSQYLKQDVADSLSELIESPNVYLQQGDKFLPIVITNSDYIHYTNLRSQKTFQYTFNYQFANDRPAR